MTEFIFFIVGLLLGGCIGVVFMCCLQINRLYKTDSMKKEVEAKALSSFPALLPVCRNFYSSCFKQIVNKAEIYRFIYLLKYMALGYLFIQHTVKAVLQFLALAKHPFHTLSFDASIIPHLLPFFYISLDFFGGFEPSPVLSNPKDWYVIAVRHM